MPPITYGVSRVNPSSGYISGQATTATVTWNDEFPFYQDLGDGTYYYATPFNLYSASSGGTNYGEVGNYSNIFGDDVSPLVVSSSVTLTIPSGLSTGTYYLGRPISGTVRRAISVTGAASNITISFNINGGTGTTPTSLVNTPGSSFTLPTSSGFSRGGYTTTQWNTASNGSGTSYNMGSSYIFNNNTTLYAVWVPNTYTIIINENGGSNVSDGSYTVSDSNDQLFLLNKPNAPTGQEFSSWDITTNSIPNGANLQPNNVLSITAGEYGDITVRANWSYENYTITYELQGGSGVHGNPTSYTYVTPTIILDQFIDQGDFGRNGYTFVGWFDADTGGNQVTSIPKNSTGNKTLYARWTIINYTITYNLNDGTNATGNPTTYNVESETIPLESATRTGYTFGGWYTDANLTAPKSQITSGSTGSITLYAKWNIITYTITYNVDDETNAGGNPTTYTIESAKIDLANATKSGFTFNGWYSEDTFTNEVTQIVSGSTGNRTLYAKFTVNGYDVIFVNNGVEVQNTEEEFGATITFNGDTPTKTDPKNRYFFLGWNTNMSATTPLTSLGTVPVGGITFYAIYESFVSGLKINLKDVNIKVGTTQVKAVYKGEDLIWEDYNE